MKHDNCWRLNKRIWAGPAAPRNPSQRNEYRSHSQRSFFPEGHVRFQRAAAQVVLRYRGMCSGSRASQRFSGRKRGVHFTALGAGAMDDLIDFSLSQQDNKCLEAPSRESHAPQQSKKKSNRHAVAHQQVCQSQENQRAQRRTLKTCVVEKHHPSRYATKNFTPLHCRLLARPYRPEDPKRRHQHEVPAATRLLK